MTREKLCLRKSEVMLHRRRKRASPHNNFGEGGGRGVGATYPSHPQESTYIFLQCLCETVKLDHKCTNLIYVPFILFEGISKSILFNSILSCAILQVFNVRNVVIGTNWGRGLRSVYSRRKVWPPLAPHQYSEP